MPLLLPLLLALAGCGQDLHFKVSYADVDGLEKGAPVVLDNQPVGKVTGVEPGQGGEHLVELGIRRESAAAATSESSFVLAPDPEQPGRRRIEIVLAGPGGKPIADGAVVKGSYPSPLGFLPLGSLLRGFGDALRDLRGQVDQFRQDFQKLPDSPEAKRLQEEWRKLTEDIAKAQGETSDTLKKDLLPKLEQEMEAMRKRMEEMQKPPQPGKKPVEL
jgi:hypothetical protein